MSDYGLKIALPGKNTNSSDERDYALWSKFKLYKISGSGSGNVTNSASVSFQGGRHYSLGVKKSNKWYMAGATGGNNAGEATLSAQDNTVLQAPPDVYGNAPFTWTLQIVGAALPYFYYFTIDTL